MDKEIRRTCHVDCPYFPQEVRDKDIKKEQIKDGIKYRTVIRRCGYNNKVIRDWRHICPLNE